MEGAGLKKEEPVEIEIEDLYELSPTQQGMLFHSLERPDSGLYFNQVSCVFDVPIDLAALERAWQQILDRHSILRTAFVWEDLAEPLQVVCRNVRLTVKQEDWRSLSPAEQQERFDAYLTADRRRGFNLSEAPLMRAAVIRTTDESSLLVWSHHHLLLDGWSVSILLQEVFAYYAAYSRAERLELPKPCPYVEYVNWLKRLDLSGAEDFWRKKLKDFSAPNRLGIDHRRLSGVSPGQNYDRRGLRLSEAATVRLQTFARQHRLMLNTLVQGAWALLLSCYSGDPDVVFGTTFSGRPSSLPGAERMVGLFINLLPVRIEVAPEQPLVAWLKRLQDGLVEMRQYEFSPLVRIQEWSEVHNRTPLFDSILGFENAPVFNAGGGSGADNLLRMQATERTNYPLTIKAFPERELGLEALYDCPRFDGQSIARLLGHLQALLESMTANPQQRLGELSPLTPGERQQVLVEWNETAADYPRRAPVDQWFRTQVEKTPDAVAVRFGDQQLSYARLRARAERLACHLARLGVEPEVIVGIYMPRSVDMLIALLAVMRAGGAYLPLDPASPRERLGYMLKDSGAAVVLTEGGLAESLSGYGGEVIRLDEDWAQVAAASAAPPAPAAAAENLVYVIYTSGSTGLPKAVMVSHQGLANYLAWALNAYAVEAGKGAPVHSPLAFDLTVTSLLLPLITGGCVVLVADEEGVEGLAQALKRRSAFSLVKITPSHLEILTHLLADEDLGGMANALVIGGEALLAEDLRLWRECAPEVRLVNEYGPTETVVGCCVYEVAAGDPMTGGVPIGRPIANTRLYLLNARAQPLPVGVAGELYIGGAGLARGYLKQPQITAEKFVPDPFSVEPGARLYKTGDMARYRAGGDIEFLGRRDTQVKVRGFRIELGEIEAVLNSHDEIGECAVVPGETATGDRQLVAYVVARPGQKPVAVDLRNFLSDRLPEYMIPAAFVTLDALPLNANGKIERQRLPALDEARGLEVRGDFVAPRDSIEQQLAEVWESVLEIRPVSLSGNFFDLGGHSITAVRLLAQVQKRFGLELPLNSLMRAPTVEGMAALIREQTGSLDWSPVVDIQPKGSRRPFFCVHPVGGNVLRYRDLARHIGEDQPFYALEAPGLSDERNHYVMIESLASYYIDHIRQIQPEGPYLLGGHSFGGFIAYEMAQQLLRRGEPVGLLALLDTPAPEYVKKPIDDATLLVGRIREIGREVGMGCELSSQEVEHLSRQEMLDYLINFLRKNNLLTEDMDAGWISRYLEGLRARERAVLVYNPPAGEGRITLFRADEMEPEARQLYEQQGLDANEPTLGWGKRMAQPVEVQVVPGFHDTMMFEPQVQTLAAKMRQCMDRAEAEYRSSRST